MRQGIARMDIKQRLTAHRTLSLILTFLTLVGWGGFAYSAGSAAIATHDLRAELAQSQAAQDLKKPVLVMVNEWFRWIRQRREQVCVARSEKRGPVTFGSTRRPRRSGFDRSKRRHHHQ